MKPKKYSEVNYIAVKESIQRDFKILSIFSTAMTIIALILSIACMKLGVDNEELKMENEELRKIIEMKQELLD